MTLAELFDACDLKLPLSVAEADNDNFQHLVDANGEVVGECYEPGLCHPVVAAVNHIDALAAALRKFMHWQSGVQDLLPDDLYSEATAALAAYDAAKGATDGK